MNYLIRDPALAHFMAKRSRKEAINELLKEASERKQRTINSVSHAALSVPALDILFSRLESFDQQVGGVQKRALEALIHSMTEMAQGELEGRYAFGLPTGTGKTQSIVSWASAVAQGGFDHISMAISAFKVEALCELKRELVSAGVPEDKIALIHSYKDGQASESSDDEDRQIVLVTHERIRNGSSIERFHKYQRRVRDLLIYDESLLSSDSVGVPLNDLKGAIGWLQGKHGHVESNGPLLAYGAACIASITEALEEMVQSEERLITLPSPDKYGRVSVVERAKVYAIMEPVRNLLDISHDPVRIIKDGQGGVVWYRVAVPEEIENIIVLDASHPIRELVKLDPTIKDAEEHIDLIKNIGMPLSKIKSFEDVILQQMIVGGGRSTMLDDFRGDRKRAKEIAKLISELPSDEAILVFTYKERPGESMNYQKTIMEELARLGVDVDQNHGDRKRINVITWGMETSLNDYNHCSRVILAGVLQRNPVDLTASYLGQSDDLTRPVCGSIVSDLQLSESVHLAYQALSRGTCRNIENGRAKPMVGYIMHMDERIQTELSKVMPGVKWEPWVTRLENSVKPKKVKTHALAVASFLEHYHGEEISSRKLKEAVCPDLDTRSFSRSLEQALSTLPDWDKPKGSRSVIKSI